MPLVTSGWDWWEGNWSCDCNRRPGFFDEHEESGEQEGICLGALRYVVVGMSPMPEGFTLDEFNDRYPPELQQMAMQCRATREGK